MDNNSLNQTPETQEPKKFDKKLIVAWVIAGAVALTMIGLFIYNTKFNNTNLQPTVSNPNNNQPTNSSSTPNSFTPNPYALGADNGIDNTFELRDCKNPLPPLVSKSGLVEWIEPQHKKEVKIFEPLVAKGASFVLEDGYYAEDNYLVGHFVAGKYKGGDLYLSILPYPSFAGGEYYDHIVSLNGKYYVLAKYSDNTDSIQSWIDQLTDSNISVDKTFDLPDLNYPERIALENPKATISHITQLSFESFDHLRFCADKLIKYITDPVIGDLYTNSTTTHEGFWVKLPNSTQRIYALDIDIMGKNNVPLVTWNDGKINKEEFTFRNETYCGAPTFKDVSSTSMEELAQAGTTLNGQPVYEYRDKNAPDSVAIYKASLAGWEATSTQPTLQDFLKDHSIFFWRDQFGDLVRFINKKYWAAVWCG